MPAEGRIVEDKAGIKAEAHYEVEVKAGRGGLYDQGGVSVKERSE